MWHFSYKRHSEDRCAGFTPKQPFQFLTFFRLLSGELTESSCFCSTPSRRRLAGEPG